MYNDFNSQTLKLMMTQPYFQRDSYTRNFVCSAFQPQLSSTYYQTPLTADANLGL